MFEYQVFGSVMGQVTRSWKEVEAQDLEAAKTWPLSDIANLVEAPQTFHVVIREKGCAELVRGDVKFDGERMEETWLQ